MACTIDFGNGKKYSEDFANKNLRKSIKFNSNINYMGNKGTMSILREYELIDRFDKEKYGLLIGAGSQKIKQSILKANSEGGISAVRELLNESIAKVEAYAESIPVPKSVQEGYTKRINKSDAVYQEVIDFLSMDTAQRAMDAGVSEEDMSAYEAGAEDLNAATYDKISKYMKGALSKDANDLFKMMRSVINQAFPMFQRANSIIGEDGYFSKADLIVQDGAQRAAKAEERMKKVFGNKYAAYLRDKLKGLLDIVPIDNLLMKMGFAKGTAQYEIFFNAPSNGLRNTVASIYKYSSVIGNLMKDDKYGNATKHYAARPKNGGKYTMHDIDFLDAKTGKTKKVSISGAEAIAMYMTFAQADIYSRAVVGEDRLAKAIAENKLSSIPSALIGEHMKDGKQEVIITEDAFRTVQNLVEKEYPDFRKAVRPMLDEMWGNMSETTFNLTGQRVGFIEDYFPTFEARSDSDYQLQNALLDDFNSIDVSTRYIKERMNGIKVYDIRDAFTLMDSYIKSTSRYTNMAIPLRNANVLYNAMRKEGVFDGEYKKIGENLGKWIMEEINNSAQMEYGDTDKAFNKIMGLYYKGVLGWNVPVVLKQPTAALHLVNYFGDIRYGKYVAEAYKLSLTGVKKEMDEIIQYNPSMGIYLNNVVSPELGRILETGGFSNLGTLVNSGIGGAAKKLGSAYIDNSLEMIRKADLATRVAMWKASKEYVAKEFGLSEKDGSTYWDSVTNIFNQVNEDTQQTFDLFHRSRLGRSNNPIVRSVLMFTTQLQKQLSMMDKAITNYALYSRPEDRKNLMMTSASVLIMQSMLVAMIDLGRDALLGYDDDDEDKTKKVLANTLSNNLAILPFVNLYSNRIANGVFQDDLLYERPVSTPLVDGMEYLGEVLDKAFEADAEGLLNGIWTEGSKYAGIPLAPFRQFEAIMEKE